MTYDVIIIGAGPGGIFSAYELMQRRPEWKVAVLEAGNPLEKRHCPIDGDKVKSCIHCKTCAIMCTSTLYCTTFQLLAASISWLRWLRIAFSVWPETLKVME